MRDITGNRCLEEIIKEILLDRITDVDLHVLIFYFFQFRLPTT